MVSLLKKLTFKRSNYLTNKIKCFSIKIEKAFVIVIFNSKFTELLISKMETRNHFKNGAESEKPKE